MKVKIFAFETDYSEGYTLNEFFEFVEKRQTVEVNQTDHAPGHIVAVQRKGDYWVGLFVTVKDQKAFMRFRRTQKHFALIPEKLGDDVIAEFNHFVVNTNTSKGLYQWYHQSGGVAGLTSFLKTYYNQERDKKKQAAMDAKSTDADKAKEKQRYGMTLRTTLLCRNENFEGRVRSLAHIKNMEFTVKTYQEEKSDRYGPLSRFVKGKKEIVTFEKKVGLVTSVANFVKDQVNKAKNLRVEGVDEDGHDQIYKLLNDHDVFEETDYESILDNLKIDSSDLKAALSDSVVITRMLEVAEDKAKKLLTGRTRKT
ncbi:MAG: hypothetical protein V4662_13835 [Verrucomicrobiota bacterium]